LIPVGENGAALDCWNTSNALDVTIASGRVINCEVEDSPVMIGGEIYQYVPFAVESSVSSDFNQDVGVWLVDDSALKVMSWPYAARTTVPLYYQAGSTIRFQNAMETNGQTNLVNFVHNVFSSPFSGSNAFASTQCH
jgi:hypothetical protein